MNFSIDPGKVVKAVGGVVSNPGQVLTNPVGTANAFVEAAASTFVGTPAPSGDGGAQERVNAYNARIAEVKAAAPDYTKLEVEWKKFTKSRMADMNKLMYKRLNLSAEQLETKNEIDVDNYRQSLTDEQYNAQLKQLHEQYVGVAVKQLEYERDHPDNPSIPDPSDNEEGVETTIIKALWGFITSSVAGNIEGMERESGMPAKALRGLLGISARDIEEHGILGGENSYLRQITPQWTDGRVLGGENSFFRKNLGLPW